MNSKEIISDLLQIEVIFVIGTEEELSNYFNTQVKVEKLGKDPKKYIKDTVNSKLKSTGYATKGKITFNTETGYRTFFIVMNTNFESLMLLNKSSYLRKIKSIFYHECRHVVDNIIEYRRLSYSDLELTALLQSWINTEFEETLTKWIDSQN